MLIGFVLAMPAERFLHLSMSRYGFEWMTRPIVIVVALLALFVIFGGQIFKQRKAKEKLSQSEASSET